MTTKKATTKKAAAGYGYTIGDQVKRHGRKAPVATTTAAPVAEVRDYIATDGRAYTGTMAEHMRAADYIAARTADAYSYERYGATNWRACALHLVTRGYSEAEAETILRSKWMRHAADNTVESYGRVPVAALANYLDAMPDAVRARRVAELVGIAKREAGVLTTTTGIKLYPTYRTDGSLVYVTVPENDDKANGGAL